jgi:hypothetical protein
VREAPGRASQARCAFRVRSGRRHRAPGDPHGGSDTADDTMSSHPRAPLRTCGEPDSRQRQCRSANVGGNIAPTRWLWLATTPCRREHKRENRCFRPCRSIPGGFRWSNARDPQDCVGVLEHAELSNRGLRQEPEQAGPPAELTVTGAPSWRSPMTSSSPPTSPSSTPTRRAGPPFELERARSIAPCPVDRPMKRDGRGRHRGDRGRVKRIAGLGYPVPSPGSSEAGLLRAREHRSRDGGRRSRPVAPSGRHRPHRHSPSSHSFSNHAPRHTTNVNLRCLSCFVIRLTVKLAR